MFQSMYWNTFLACIARHLYDNDLKAIFVNAFNSLITDRESVFAAYDDIIADLIDNTALEKEAQSIQSECDVVLKLMRKLLIGRPNVQISKLSCRRFERKSAF